MSFAIGFSEGMEATLGGSQQAKKGTGTGNKNFVSSEIRKGITKIFPGGKSGRSKVSSADAAKEYPGLDTGGYGDE